MAETARKNVGRIDRAARVGWGVVLVLFALACPWAAAQGAAVQWIAGIVGGVLLVTGAVGVCPLYRMLGICT